MFVNIYFTLWHILDAVASEWSVTCEQYRIRTDCGDRKSGSCTLNLRGVKREDAVMYYFRIVTNGIQGIWLGQPGVTLYVTGKEIILCFMSVKYYCYLLGVWISHEKDDPIRISIHGHDTTQEKMHVDKNDSVRFDSIRFNEIRCSSIIENTALWGNNGPHSQTFS